MRLPAKCMKCLRIFHIVTASVWFGATACIGALAVMCFFHMDREDFLATAPLIPSLYQSLVLPTGLITMLQGLVYSVFTGWGFAKFKWVLWKWIMTLLLIPCIGAGAIAQTFAAISKAESQEFLGGFADGSPTLFFIFLQLLIMLIMIVISVIKPGKKRAT